VAELQKSYSGSFLDVELNREFWGSVASFLILREIATKS